MKKMAYLSAMSLANEALKVLPRSFCRLQRDVQIVISSGDEKVVKEDCKPGFSFNKRVTH